MNKPKVVKSLTELRNEKVGEVQEKGFRKLDKLFDKLWEQAEGVRFLVTPNPRRNEKPKNATPEGIGYVIEHICPKCKLPVPKEPLEVYEVWKEKPDSMLLRYLYDQMVGRSSQKDKETVDPEINIIFGDIESEPPVIAGDEQLIPPPRYPAQNPADAPLNLGIPDLEY